MQPQLLSMTSGLQNIWKVRWHSRKMVRLIKLEFLKRWTVRTSSRSRICIRKSSTCREIMEGIVASSNEINIIYVSLYTLTQMYNRSRLFRKYWEVQSYFPGKPGIVMHACNSSIWAEAGLTWIQRPPELHRETLSQKQNKTKQKLGGQAQLIKTYIIKKNTHRCMHVHVEKHTYWMLLKFLLTIFCHPTRS